MVCKKQIDNPLCQNIKSPGFIYMLLVSTDNGSFKKM